MAGKTVLEEFVSLLGWEIDDKTLQEYEDGLVKVKDTTIDFMKWTTLSAAALGGFVTIMNSGTAESKALADALGVSVETLESLGKALEPVGLDAENVADIVEEMNNKLGESRGLNEPMTAVSESLKILGLEYQNIKDLAPEEQFQNIVDAALELEDQQKAVAAVDILTGAEANRIIGYLQAQGLTLQEILRDYRDLNFLTEEGIAGAEEYTAAFNDIKTVGESIAREFSGIFGANLAPFINQIRDWAVANKEVIATRIREFVQLLLDVFMTVYKVIESVVTIVYDLIEAFGGLRNVILLLLTALSTLAAVKVITFFHGLAAAISGASVASVNLTAILGKMRVALLGLKVGAGLLIAYLLIQDFITFMEGGDSVLRDFSEEFGNILEDLNKAGADYFGVDPEIFRAAVLAGLEAIPEFFAETVPQFFTGDLPNFFSEFLPAKVDEFLNYLIATMPQGFIEAAMQVAVIFDELINYVVSLFNELTNFVSETFNATWEQAINNLVNLFTNAFNTIKQKINDLLGFLPDTVKTTLGIDDTGTPGGAAGGQGGLGALSLSPDLFGGAVGQLTGATNNSVSNTQNVNLTVSPNLNVTQQAAQDPTVLKNEVSKAIGDEVRTAFSDITTGRKR